MGTATATNRTTTTRSRDRLGEPNRAQENLLRIASEFFCFTAKQASEVLASRGLRQSDHRKVSRAAKPLADAGLLRRAKVSDPNAPIERESYAYGLTDKGVALALARGWHTETTKPFDTTPMMLHHQLAVTRFHIDAAALCSARGWHLGWRQTNLKKGVDPDALLSITDPTLPEGSDTAHFMLEMERAKLGNYRDGKPQILRRLLRYWDYFAKGTCAEEYDIPAFRVITVQLTRERSENLARIMAAECQRRTFWMTHEEAARADLGGRIFVTPKGDRLGFADALRG